MIVRLFLNRRNSRSNSATDDQGSTSNSLDKPGRTSTLAGDARPELMRRPVSLEITRAQGRPGARCTRGLVCKRAQKHAHEHTGSAGASRPSLRSGFTAYFVLSPVNGSIATVVGGISPAQLSASTAAPGPHDFAVRIRPRSSVAALASTASHRTFVTMANAPHLP